MSIGFGEIILILLIAFLVVGPKDLPKVGRNLAMWVKKIKEMMREVNKSFEQEIGLDELKSVVKEGKEVNTEFQKVQEEVLRHAKESEDILKDNKTTRE